MSVFSSRWFQLSVSLILLGVLFVSADWRAFVNQLRAAQPGYVGLAFVGYVLGQVLSAYKWRLLARVVGFDQSLRAFISYYFGGMCLNLFAPSTIAGDMGRSVLLAGGREGVGRALQSVFIDRASGVVMLIWVSALSFVVLGPTVLPAVVCYGTIAAAAGAGLVWWLLPRLMALLFVPGHVIRRSSEKLFEPYHTRPRLILGVCILAFGFHVFQIGLLPLVAHALNISIPFWYLMVGIPLVTLVSGLPLSVGGLGVREASYVFFLSLIGIGQNEALALSLVWTALVFGAGLVGGLVLFVSPDTRARFQQLGRFTRKTTAGSESSLPDRRRPKSF